MQWKSAIRAVLHGMNGHFQKCKLSSPFFLNQGQVTPASGPSPVATTAASSSTSLNQPPPLLRPSLPATPALHRQPPPLQQQARFLLPRPALNQPPPLIRPSNPLPPRLNPRPTAPVPSMASAAPGQLPPTLVGIPSETPSSSLH